MLGPLQQAPPAPAESVDPGSKTKGLKRTSETPSSSSSKRPGPKPPVVEATKGNEGWGLQNTRVV